MLVYVLQLTCVSRGSCCYVGTQMSQVVLFSFCKWVSVIGNNGAIACSQFIVWLNCNYQRFRSPLSRTTLFSVGPQRILLSDLWHCLVAANITLHG